NLNITVTDPSGVPTTGIGLPRVSYNKNNGPWIDASCLYISGGNYQCALSASAMGGVTVGDTVRYYVAAQDNASPPNGSANPSTGASGFTPDPPSFSTRPTSPNSYRIATGYSGLMMVCPIPQPCGFETLTGANGVFNALNNGVVTGNLDIQIAGDLTTG